MKRCSNCKEKFSKGKLYECKISGVAMVLCKKCLQRAKQLIKSQGWGLK